MMSFQGGLSLPAAVSILSRPFERLQLTAYIFARAHPQRVSILSRPFERLQLSRIRRFSTIDLKWFQSSAALSSGCNLHAARIAGTRILTGFNPQPPSRAAATSSVEDVRAVRSICFNPQPPSRAAATRLKALPLIVRRMFQSSAALSSGCNARFGSSNVQPQIAAFQSSAALSSGCNTVNSRPQMLEVT